ncbi:hypothetical protein, partial [Flavobacterium sp. 3-210]
GVGGNGCGRQYARAGDEGGHGGLRSPETNESDRMVGAFGDPKKGLNFHEVHPFWEYKGYHLAEILE